MLGHILFLAYINIVSQVRLFADDTAIYLTLDSKSDRDTLQKELDRLQTWEARWDMQFNPPKCQVIRVTASRTPLQTQFILNGQVLETVSSVRYLGVDISSNMSRNIHVNRITSDANRSLRFMKRNIKIKSPQIREAAYQSLVRPQLEYASISMGLQHQRKQRQAGIGPMTGSPVDPNDYASTTSVTSLMAHP